MKLAYARFMQQMTRTAMQVQGATAMLAGERPAARRRVDHEVPALAVAAHRRRLRPDPGQHHRRAGPRPARGDQPDRDVPFRDLAKAGR